jgi:HEAT repeat protein
VQAKLVELLKHKDPGVRGRAADTLASMAGPDEAKRDELAKAILPLLGDENPYTKSAACSALAWLRHQPAIHRIIELVDDDTKNTYDIRDFNELNGNAGWVHHDGSAWSQVSDAALYALKSLSHETGEKFDYKVDAKKVDDDLKKGASDAKAWYAKVKGKVPRE